MSSIHVGTSGWHYDGWRGPFYPDSLPAEDQLAYYSERLRAVEINNTFYQRANPETLRQWRTTVPDEFVFAVKAHRYITHMKKLKDPEGPLRILYSGVEALGDQLGPILFQLPPRWHRNLERLEHFLTVLSSEYEHVFEFRDPTWLTTATYDLLSAHDAGFCVHDFGDLETPSVVTSDTAYVRLHGTAEEIYHGAYDEAALDAWADTLTDWADEGHDAYLFFNNTDSDDAPIDAQRLQARLQTGGASSSEAPPRAEQE